MITSQIETYLSTSQIQNRVKELGAEISSDYQNEEVVIIGVLNGSFIFCADLVRSITSPCQVDFLSASSYGEGTVSSGEVMIVKDIKIDIKDKHVIIVEDIIDSGLTLKVLLSKLKERNPKSLEIASFLSKPSRREHQIDVKYVGFEIDDKFVIGYGLDFAGKFRELPYVGIYHGDV